LRINNIPVGFYEMNTRQWKASRCICWC